RSGRHMGAVGGRGALPGRVGVLLVGWRSGPDPGPPRKRKGGPGPPSRIFSPCSSLLLLLRGLLRGSLLLLRGHSRNHLLRVRGRKVENLELVESSKRHPIYSSG